MHTQHISTHMHLTRKGPTFTPQQGLHYPLLRGLHHFLACPMQGYACSKPEGQLAPRAVVPRQPCRAQGRKRKASQSAC